MPPDKSARNTQAEDCREQFQLDHRPKPQAAHGRCLFHDREIAIVVANVDEIASCHDAHDRENTLTDVRLVLFSNPRNEDSVGLVWVQRPEQDEKYCSSLVLLLSL